MTNSRARHLITNCGGSRLLGGFGVGGKGIFFKRTFNLPRHTRVSVSFKGWSIDSWDNELY